jgi:curved DNA-binding protein CbpA
MDIDPYKTLGVPRNFTLEQLKTSYKKIALSVHPDKTPGNSDYMFKIVTKCYKTPLYRINKALSRLVVK